MHKFKRVHRQRADWLWIQQETFCILNLTTLPNFKRNVSSTNKTLRFYRVASSSADLLVICTTTKYLMRKVLTNLHLGLSTSSLNDSLKSLSPRKHPKDSKEVLQQNLVEPPLRQAPRCFMHLFMNSRSAFKYGKCSTFGYSNVSGLSARKLEKT